MNRAGLHQHLEAMEWQCKLERDIARACVPTQYRSIALDPCLSEGERRELLAGVPELAEDAPSVAARPGLVSVLTTQTRRSEGLVPFRVAAAAQAAHEALGTFAIDSEAVEKRRIARLRMQVGVAARQHCVQQGTGVECLMVTLTYAGTNADWRANHVRAFMDTVRHWYKRRGLKCRYVIHYHVALWVPTGTKLPKPDEAGWWPHGMTRIEVARAAVPYLLKYLSKDASKTLGAFPKGARIYGVGGLDHVMRRARRWLSLPRFVQNRSSISDDWRRAEGGGWVDPAGQHWPSEFECCHVAGKRSLRRLHTHEPLIDASGPFCWRVA